MGCSHQPPWTRVQGFCCWLSFSPLLTSACCGLHRQKGEMAALPLGMNSR